MPSTCSNIIHKFTFYNKGFLVLFTMSWIFGLPRNLEQQVRGINDEAVKSKLVNLDTELTVAEMHR